MPHFWCFPSRPGADNQPGPFGPLETETFSPPPNPFPKPAPSFANIPVILLLFCAHEVKIFFFSPPLPFSPPPPSLPHSCRKRVGWHPLSQPPLRRLGPSCWPRREGFGGGEGGDARSGPSSCLITSSKRAGSFTAARPTRTPVSGVFGPSRLRGEANTRQLCPGKQHRPPVTSCPSVQVSGFLCSVVGFFPTFPILGLQLNEPWCVKDV